MINSILEFAGKVIEVKVENGNLSFKSDNLGGYYPIENIKLSKDGCIKEHPDLKDNPEWRTESIKRLKEHISKINDDNKIMDYVIFELCKIGYNFLSKQRSGFRTINKK